VVKNHLNGIGAKVIGQGRRNIGGTNIDWVDVSVMIRAHMAIRQKAIGKQGQ
jgi:hypothetical protein